MKSNKYYGYISAFSAYVIWGLLPIYWKELGGIAAEQQLAIRVIMTVITLAIVLILGRNNKFIEYIKTPKTRYALFLSAFLIAINWGIFVYAVSNEQVLQASLGYYINPLVSVFLGILIMKEKMKKIQYVSIGLAIAGVLYMTINYGQFPWISILLALSFAFYGLLKKLLDLDSMNSLFVEVLFILPFMLFLLFQSDINNIISSTTFDIVLMLFAGVVTIIPLVLFAEGVKRIPLSVVGFLQYIAPTLMLLLGVIRYGEEFTMAHGVSFSLIWAGLILFSISSLRTESIETQ